MMATLYPYITRKVKLEGVSLERSSVAIFLFVCTISIVGVIVALTMVDALGDPVYRTLNAIQGTVFAVLLALLLSGRIFVKRAILLFAITAQSELVGEMIYGIVLNSPFTRQLAVGNMTLCFALVVLTIVTSVRYMPVILSVVSTGAFGVFAWMTSNEHLIPLLMFLGAALILTSLMGEVMHRRLAKLEKDNKEYDKEITDIQHFLHLDRSKLRHLIAELKHNAGDPEKTTYILEMLGKRSKDMLVHKAREVLRMEQYAIAILLDKYPSITPAEQEICSLTLQGKSVSEICGLTGKTVSNVTCTRSHIRKKLGLDKSANLLNELRKITQTPVRRADSPGD